jgi:hypothetical protein
VKDIGASAAAGRQAADVVEVDGTADAVSPVRRGGERAGQGRLLATVFRAGGSKLRSSSPVFDWRLPRPRRSVVPVSDLRA